MKPRRYLVTYKTENGIKNMYVTASSQEEAEAIAKDHIVGYTSLFVCEVTEEE